MEEDGGPRIELLELLRDRVDDEVTDRQDAGFVEAARTVVELWREWWGAGQPVAVPSAVEPKFRMIYPFALHALNNVALGLDLSDRLPWVAAEHARIAFEHALTAQWVLLTHEGEQDLLVELQNEAHAPASADLVRVVPPGPVLDLRRRQHDRTVRIPNAPVCTVKSVVGQEEQGSLMQRTPADNGGQQGWGINAENESWNDSRRFGVSKA